MESTFVDSILDLHREAFFSDLLLNVACKEDAEVINWTLEVALTLK